jgi:Putative adhesin
MRKEDPKKSWRCIVDDRLIPVSVLAALTVFLLANPRTAQADEWHKAYTVSGKPTVHVETNDGAVRVSTWDGKQIEVRVETVGWKIDDSEVRIIERQSGDRLDFEARVPRFNWNSAFNRHSLRIELRIPREADLNVHTGDGSVETGNNIGLVDIHTGDGHISVRGAKGDIRLSTGDGHIEATSLDGRLDASSGDGRIEVEGRLDSMNLKTNDGTIDARILRGSRMATSWSVRSGDGAVTLRLPADFQADLDAHTGDGRITTEFPITASGKISRAEIRGKLNGGGQALTARTGDGSINILKY